MAKREFGVLEGDVRAMALGGEAVVATERGVVLAPGAAPGERVRVRGVHRRAGVLRGRLDAVLTPSADRVDPPCAHVDACGGCPLMHLSAAVQQAVRQGFVAEAAARAGWTGEVVVHGGPALGYRRRARLSWRGGRSPLLGYHRRRSHGVAAIDSCAVLEPALEVARAALAAVLPSMEGDGEAHLARGVGGEVAVTLQPAQAQPPGAYAACETLAGAPGVAGVALGSPDSPALAQWGDSRDVVEGPDGELVVGAPGGFSQANDVVNRRLVARVAALAASEGQRVLELFAGAGNLTMALAPGTAAYVAVEADRAAAAACTGNLAARGLDGAVRVVAGDAAERAARVAHDLLVLDPPRTGAREALAAAVKGRPRRIVYVSCDPPTLGRDLAALAGFGYAVEAVEAFEMFPQTSHVEAVVVLGR